MILDPAVLARSQMAMSLAFHIIFASVGVAMPVLMVAAEIMWLRTGEKIYLDLAKRWAKGTAVLFAIGAVSGTVLSFELGLLFPVFMKHAGALVGLPFSLEGFAFFTEAIFLGIYLYGWSRVSPRVHVMSGIIVAASGAASALFVTFVNAWMNAPSGFVMQGTDVVAIDALAALKTPYALHELPHTLFASYMATGLAVAGIHAFGLLRPGNHDFHRRALTLALAMVIPCALIQPLIGHFAGQQVAQYQPAKLAATEGLMHTQTRAPLELGPLKIEGGLSFMAFNDWNAKVIGLADFPPEDRPSSIVRVAFLTMVGLGTLAGCYAMWAAWLFRKRKWQTHRRFLWATLAAAPAGFIALEAGWVVTEVGRQPWVIYNVLRTANAVTPVPALGARLAVFALVYLSLGVTVAIIITRHVRLTLSPTRSP